MLVVEQLDVYCTDSRTKEEVIESRYPNQILNPTGPAGHFLENGERIPWNDVRYESGRVRCQRCGFIGDLRNQLR
jgi:hypothetical protein